MALHNGSLVRIQLTPDWSKLMTGSEAEVELKDFKFLGPGWYVTKTDTMLVSPDEETRKPWVQTWPADMKFRFHCWNNTDVGDYFNAAINAPTRVDERD